LPKIKAFVDRLIDFLSFDKIIIIIFGKFTSFNVKKILLLKRKKIETPRTGETSYEIA